jgi:hypothetical protein
MENLWTFFLYIFFLYGLIGFIQKLIFEVRDRKRVREEKGKIILIVKNQEQLVEPVLRVLDYYGITVEVVDCKSVDNTNEIIKRLSYDLDTIDYVDGEFDVLEGRIMENR